MPVELYNPPLTFLSMITDIFCDMLDVKVIAYMDDILIYTESVEEPVALLR